jgi:RND family efflux transporter MFP subunit
MKQVLFLILIIAVQGCSDKAVTHAPSPLVVQTTPVIERIAAEEFTFPAVVAAVKTIEIKFQVAGRLIKTNLIKGKKIEKGDVLAKIDSSAFLRKVSESQVIHTSVAKDLKRIKELFENGVVSQSMLDDANTTFKTTLYALEKAKEELDYCTIKAPFNAYVSERYTENNSYIKIGDSLATLQDRSTLYFSVDIPERVLAKSIDSKTTKASVKLINIDRSYNIKYVEHSASPDPITQTYNVTFEIENTKESELTPGSKAVVTIVTNAENKKELIIPLSAVTGDPESGFNVWLLVDSKDTVKRQKVTISTISGNKAVISTGLTLNNKVVTAAVNLMKEGLTVKEYKAQL